MGDMKILTVEYRRLVTYGGYNNETIGATVAVDESGADAALENIKAWVDSQFTDASTVSSLKNEINELQWKKNSLERQFDMAGRRWEAVLAFMKSIGIERPQCIPETLDDLPF